MLAYLRNLGEKFFRPSEVAEEMDEELREHIALRADDLERGGLSRDEAERRARIEFGGSVKYREQSYEAMGGSFLETLMQDLRFALRVLRKSRGFAFAAIVTLALAIGANAVVFGIMDALVLHTLNVPNSQNLYGTLYGEDPQFRSYPNYADLRDGNHSFQDLAAFNFTLGTAIDTGNDPQGASGFATTGNYFTVLDVQPYLGRFYTPADLHGPGSAPYLVLSYGYWHSRFHDDRGVIGRVVNVNKHPFTVIGVTPPEFAGTLMFVSPEFFMPIVEQETIGGNSLTDRTNWQALFESFGHLKPGVTPQQAEADVNRVTAGLARAYPKEFDASRHVVLGRTGLTSFGPAVHGFVAALMGLAGLILLAACANLGSLFAAHSADRAKEVALRLALGSTRRRILRQLMTEALLLSLAGGTLGVLAGMPLLRELSTWHPFPAAQPLHIPVTMDARIYAVALVLAVISGLLFGIVPVRQVMRAHPYEVIRAGSANRTGRKVTVREVLLVVQIALCAVLVTASLVAVRGLMRSVNASYGFDPRNVMTAGVNLANAGYSGNQIGQFNRRMIDAMQTIPGVEAVGLVDNYPPLVDTAAFRERVFTEQTRDRKPANVAISPFRYNVSPGYLKAAGTTLLAGRDFSWDDDKRSLVPALANRQFAVKMFGSVSGAIGRHFRIGDGTLVEIAGVIEDGKYLALTEDREPAFFLPSMRDADPQSYLIVRSNRDPEQLAALMRSKIRELDPGLPVDIQSWNQLLDVVQFPAKVATMALGVLGMMGAVLSITGIFGLAAYSVSRRLKELGIRIALGARRIEVLGTALGRAVKLLAIGSAAGLLLGLLATRVLAAIVYQATPRDPVVLGGVVAAMALLGLVATWIPAQRALSINILALLREE